MDVFVYFCIKVNDINVLVIENKSYVVVPLESYEALQKQAASKEKQVKLFSVAQAREHSKKLIREWSKGE